MTLAASLHLFAHPLSALRLGPLRLSPYGACAALGLVLGMALARPAARRLGLHPDHAWDAGLFALLACLVSSRLLLIAENARAFLHYPLLVLSLPSLTLGGIALAALALGLYLRRHRLALLPLLDVFAAPAALLAAFLELGHALDGSEIGMPSTRPWAVPDPWTAGAERVEPVALFGVLAALALTALLWALPRYLGTHCGRLAAVALLLGGLAAFALSMLSLPVTGLVDLALEPGQWLALAAMLAGALLWSFAPVHTANADVAAPLHGDPSEAASPPLETS